MTQPNVGWVTNQPWGVAVDPATKSVYLADLPAKGLWGFTQGLAAAIPIVIPTGAGNTGANSQPGQFLLAHIAPRPPQTASVPAASSTSLALLLAGCGALLYRKSIRTSSAQ